MFSSEIGARHSFLDVVTRYLEWVHLNNMFLLPPFLGRRARRAINYCIEQLLDTHHKIRANTFPPLRQTCNSQICGC